MKLVDDRFLKVNLYESNEKIYSKNDDNISEIYLVNNNYNIEDIKIILELSKESMIGLGSQFIRLQQKGIPDEIDIRTEPLKTSWGANQPLGFYLTPDSATLFVYHKEYGTLKDNNINTYLLNSEVDNIYKMNEPYLVDLEWDDDYLESYQLGLNNIGSLKVYYKDKDVTNNSEVIWKLSNNALLGFGMEIIRLAHNFEENKKYNVKKDNNLGMYLTNSSPELILKCRTFKQISEYDSTFNIK